ncbi:MAG: leucine-rich repeat protein [Clostridiales bacterium]|nr:leucine-rich repeat protein [Clostridiales bacterium]
MPKSLTSLDKYVFNGCTGLTDVTVPGGVSEVPKSSFSGCTGLVSVTLEEGITTIGQYAFNGCTSLKNVSLPDSLITIDKNAFYGCEAMRSITIPENTAYINSYAFINCSGLTTLVIYSKSVSFDVTPFQQCLNLQYVYCYLGSTAASYTEYPTDVTIIYLDYDPEIVLPDDELTYSRDLGELSLTSASSVSMCAGDKIRLKNTNFNVENYRHSFSINSGSEYISYLYGTEDDYPYWDIVAEAPGTAELYIKARNTLSTISSYTYSITITIEGYSTEEMVEKYDVNGDGIVTSDDASAITDYLAGSSSLSASALGKADFNGDGEVNIADAVYCLRLVKGMDTEGTSAAGNAVMSLTTSNAAFEGSGYTAAISAALTGSEIAGIQGTIVYSDSAFTPTKGSVTETSSGVYSYNYSTGGEFEFVYTSSEAADLSGTAASVSLMTTSSFSGTNFMTLKDVVVTDIYGNEFSVETGYTSVSKVTVTSTLGSSPYTVTEDKSLEVNMTVGQAIELMNCVLTDDDDDRGLKWGLYSHWSIDEGEELISFISDWGGDADTCRVIALAPGKVTIAACLEYNYGSTSNSKKDFNYGYVTINITGTAMDFLSATPDDETSTTTTTKETTTEATTTAVTTTTKKTTAETTTETTTAKATTTTTTTTTAATTETATETTTEAETYDYDTTYTMKIGETLTLTNPISASDLAYYVYVYSWSTDDTDIVSLSNSEGKSVTITAEKAGTAEVKAILTGSYKVEYTGTRYNPTTKAWESYTYYTYESRDFEITYTIVVTDGSEGEYVTAPTFKVVGVFGGRSVTFTSKTDGAVIYYSSSTSNLTTDDICIANGETVTYEDYYGTIYTRAYYNGSWSDVSKFVLKIPVVNTPTVTVSGTTVTIKSTTPDSFICYTTDGSEPVVELDGTVTNGTWLKVNGARKNSGTITASPGDTVRAVAVRNCFTTSASAAAYVPVSPAAFTVVGTFGGRNVTFKSDTSGAKIYYSSTTSSLTTSDKCVSNGQTVLFEDFYGTIYARAYYNGKWSNVSRLILKIPTINDPTITYSGGKATIRTTTPNCYIYYTTDGTTPSTTNGKKLCSNSYGQVTVSSGTTIKAIAVRSCFTNSTVVSYKVS